MVLRVRVLQSTKINYLGLNHLAPGNTVLIFLIGLIIVSLNINVVTAVKFC